MSKFLVSTAETYRVDTDDEARTLIEDAKKSSMFELGKYSSQFVPEKKKCEAYYKVVLTKKFNDIKEPSQHIKVDYDVDYNI